MSDVKNKGAFAQVYRVLDDKGNDTGMVRARATADIIIKKGQILFFDNYEENIKNLVERKYITPEEGTSRLEARKELDEKFKMKTLYALKAGDPNQIKEETSVL